MSCCRKRGDAALRKWPGMVPGRWARLLFAWLVWLGTVAGGAEERVFAIRGTPLLLGEVADGVEVRFQSFRLNRAQNVWNVEVSVTNRGPRIVNGPLVVVVESFTGTTGLLQPDGMERSSPGRAFLDLSERLGDDRLTPGEGTAPRTVAFGVASGAPRVVTKVFAGRPPLTSARALVRSTDEAGLPLPGVFVEETGPQGTRTLATDAVFGQATLGQGEGPHLWKFSLPGRLPVWREQTLSTGVVAFVASPRLVPAGTNLATLGLLDGGRLEGAGGALQVAFAPGAVTAPVTARLTALDGQSLPAFLPTGWSPLQAFHLELGAPLAVPAGATLVPWGPVSGDEMAHLARWNESDWSWEVVAQVPGAGTNALVVPVTTGGSYVLAVPDTGPGSPPVPGVGGALLPGTLSPVEGAEWVAAGVVTPASSPASPLPELVTAMATMTLTNRGGPVPSGARLVSQIEDHYLMQDGSGRHPPRYDNMVVGYQRPGDSDVASLHARFPLRPLLLFGSDRLESATVRAEVLARPEFGGVLLDAGGGELLGGGVRVVVGAGDLDGVQAGALRLVDSGPFAGLVPTPLTIVAAFELSLPGIRPGQSVEVQVASAPTDALFVLARVLYREGLYGLEPVERLRSDAAGRFSTVEPPSGGRLPGLGSAGQYLVVQVPASLGLIEGVARNALGEPTAGMPVRIEGQPWLTFSAAGGGFQLLGAAGSATVAVTDLRTGDTGFAALIVPAGGAVAGAGVSTAPAGPRVMSVSPTNGAVRVSRVTAVELQFSEPVNPATLMPSGIQLLGTNGQPVAASLTLNLAGTRATVLAVNPLAASTVHTVRVSADVADGTGLKLEGPREFQFTTESDLLNRGAAELVIYAPGATNIPPEVLANIPAYTPGEEKDAVVVVGRPGAAEPERPVILLNESTGETSTVLSKPDGSFFGLIRGSEDDFVSASIRNANGTSTYLPVSRQEFDNGFVGLYRQGGILEAETDAGPVRMTVESGAIPNRTKFKLEAIPVAEILTLLSNAPPERGKFVGQGLRLTTEGDVPREPMDVSIPVELTELEQAGLTNGTPESGVYALVSPITVDGVPGYAVVDKLQYEAGRLLTKSPPFPGIIGPVQSSASALGVFPLVMAFRSQPMIFAGRVREEFLSPDGTTVAGTRPVPGALVSVEPFTPSRPAPRGRLRTGSVVSVTDAEGSYALLLPVPELNDPGDPNPFDNEFTLIAQHPKRFGSWVEALAPPGQTLARFLDFVFRAGGGAGGADPNPPRLFVFHEPNEPRPGAEATITVVATHGSDLPSVTVVADSTLPDPIALSDVRVFPEQQQVIGPTTVRSRFPVRCDATNVLVNFRLRAEASGAPAAEVVYPVVFRDRDIPFPDPPPSDGADQVGPMVVRSTPRDDPERLAPTLGVADPILIEFNESISAEDLASAIQLSPQAGPPMLQVSPDQRRLAIRFARLKAGEEYTLTLTPAIKDLSGNRLDQNPANTVTPEAFLLRFRTAPEDRVGVLSEVESGGGAVLNGIYAYVLERAGALDGSLRVYDLSDPGDPVPVGELSLPGFPRDLALIPTYAFKLTPESPAQTNQLIAVVGGRVGGGSDGFGNLMQGFQYLWVIDVSQPESPRRVASAVVTVNPVAVVNRILWSPPDLAYLESSADAQTIGIVNLQSFILGSNLDPQDLAPVERPGIDANGDGDFVDAGDTLPEPSVFPDKFPGKVDTVALTDTTQRIVDFSYAAGLPYVGVLLASGKVIDPGTGLPGTVLPATYRTLVLGDLGFLDRQLASFELGEGIPKRLFTLFGARLPIAGGETRVANLALVTVDGGGAAVSRLDVIEFTDPTRPRLLRSVSIPAVHGIPQSIVQREDGRLLLATAGDLLVLDPARLADPPLPDGSHPALIGAFPGAGSGARTFASTLAGLNVTSLGGKSQVLQTRPTLRFVVVPEEVFDGQESLVQPEEIRDQPERIQSLLAKLEFVSALAPAPACSIEGIVDSALSPPDRQFHYHVLLHAPGSAGGEEGILELALESLDADGVALRNQGLGFPPVRAVTSESAAAIGQDPIAQWDAPIRSLTAYRLSKDKADPNYNLFLSKPFALLATPATLDELSALQDEVDRALLWSGHYLRAYIDPSLKNNAVVGPYAGVPNVREASIVPGTSVEAVTYPGIYHVGPNPPAFPRNTTAAGSFRSVSLHNGEFRHETIDLSLPSRRMPIVFKRAIGGQDLHFGPFGRGWDFNYNQRVVRVDPEVVPSRAPEEPGATPKASLCPKVLRDPSGGPASARNTIGSPRDVFLYNGQGQALLYRFAGDTPPVSVENDPLVNQLGWMPKASAFYTSPPGIFDILVRFKDEKYARLLPDGTQFWYSPAGRLETIYDRYTNNVHVLQYDALGQLVRIVDRSVDTDRYLEIGYFKQSLDPTLTDVDTVTSELRLVGLISRLRDYTGREVSYTYDPSGVLLQRDGVRVTVGLADGAPDRQRTFYTYGLGGPVGGIDAELLREFPLANNISGIVGGDPGGAALITATSYAPAMPAPTVKDFAGANGPASLDLLYDNTAATLGAGTARVKLTSADGTAMDYALDALGLPRAATVSGGSPSGVTYQTFHDSEGLPSEIRYPLGNGVRFTYDKNNPLRRSQANLLFVDRFPRDDSPSFQLAFSYDDLRYNLRLGVQTDLDGNAVMHHATADGLDVGQIVYPSRPPVLPNGVAASFPVGTGGGEEFEYNAYGQLVRHRDVNGVIRRFTYGADDGFLQSLIRGEEAGEELTTVLEYDPADTAGQLGFPHVRVTPRASEAERVVNGYNERGQLVTSERGAMRAELYYDENGRVRRRVSRIDTGRDLEERLEYEQNGFLRRRTVKGVETASSVSDDPSATPTDLVVEYEPDSMFRVRRVIYNPGGPAITREFLDFDALGRPRRMVYGGGTNPHEERYDYDDNGNLLSLTVGDAVTEYVYDGHDRLKEEIHRVDADRRERVERGYFPSGAVAEITVRDAAGQLNRRTSYQIDALGRTTVAASQADSGPAVTLFGHDGETRRRRIQSPSGEVSEIRYRGNGQPTSLEDSVQRVEFEHDANDNLERRISFEPPGSTNRYTTAHVPFDPLDRSRELADEEGRIASFDYRVDGQTTRRVDGRGQPYDYEYTLLGEPALRRLPDGVEFRTSYDEHRQPRFQGDGAEEGWLLSYDEVLRLEHHRMRDGLTFRYSDFDSRSRPRKVEFPDPASGQPADLVETRAYDQQGRLTEMTSGYLGAVRTESASYDALDRVVTNRFSDGLTSGGMTYRYDLIGPPREVVQEIAGQRHVVASRVRADGIRTNLAYPSGLVVVEERDLHGRKLGLHPEGAASVISGTEFAAADLIGGQVLGGGVLRCDNVFDRRKRLLRRRYVRPGDGGVLVDLRYAYDAADNVVARQSVHRGGRTDWFAYDANNRLVRADVGVRPPMVGAVERELGGFEIPEEVRPTGAGWAPGFFARHYRYDTNGFDLLVQATPVNPDNLSLPAFAGLREQFDAALHLGRVDGVARGRNSLANTTNAVLQVRVPGGATAEPVPAALDYDAWGRLIRIVREDGVEIRYSYLPGGLCGYRKVTGPTSRCVPSERVLVWDGPRLIEEHDLGGGQPLLRARYYYADSDVPVAADLRDGAGTLERVYLLQDVQGSVVALVDGAGGIIERYSYDPWGQPEVEPRDTLPPVLRRIASEGGSLRIEFSERVLPPLLPPAPGAPEKEFAVVFADAARGFVVEAGGSLVPGRLQLDESAAGATFGTVFRFVPESALSGEVTLRLAAGTLLDEWGNPVVGATVSFVFQPGAGVTLFQNQTQTSSAPSARPSFDQPFLFHGQVFDAEAGLVYLRARFYDPYTGLFLQPDPAGYEDSVNPYAAFAHNPTSLRDPSGQVAVHAGLAIGGAVVGASLKVYHEGMSNPDATTRDFLAAGLSGAFEGAMAGASLGASALGDGLLLGASGSILGELIEEGVGEGRIASLGEVGAAGATGMAYGVAGAAAGKAIGAVAGAVVSAASKGARAFRRLSDDPVGDFIASSRLGAGSRSSVQTTDDVLQSADSALADEGSTPISDPVLRRFQVEGIVRPHHALEKELFEQSRLGDDWGNKAEIAFGEFKNLSTGQIQFYRVSGGATGVSGKQIFDTLDTMAKGSRYELLSFFHTHPVSGKAIFSANFKSRGELATELFEGDILMYKYMAERHPRAIVGVVGEHGTRVSPIKVFRDVPDPTKHALDRILGQVGP